MKAGKITALVAMMAVLAPAAYAEDGGDRSGKRKAAFEKVDFNGDGKITKKEVLRRAGDRFDKIDANGDGVLSKDEMRSAKKGGKGGQGGDGKRNPAQMFEKLDANGDGKISKSEFRKSAMKMAGKRGGDVDEAKIAERVTKRFEAMDKDGDGFLSKGEMASAGKHKKKGGGEERRGGKGKGKDQIDATE